MSRLDTVRASCAALVADARHVRVLADRIPAYAASLPLDSAPATLDPAIHHVEPERDPEGTAAFVLALDSINFGSGWFPALFGPETSGYAAIAGALRRRWLEGPPTAAALADLTPEAAARLAGLDPSHADAAELAALFARALNDLGRLVGERHDGRFLGLVEAARGSAEALMDLLCAMPLFDDPPFWKRAQITVADLSLAFGGRSPCAFRDAGRLTAFADNLLPHVLRWDGVLVCDDTLAARIDRGEALPAGSREEMEIRAAGVHAVELIRDALGAPVTAVQVDHVLWRRGHDPAYRAKPRHITRTVFY